MSVPHATGSFRHGAEEAIRRCIAIAVDHNALSVAEAIRGLRESIAGFVPDKESD